MEPQSRALFLDLKKKGCHAKSQKMNADMQVAYWCYHFWCRFGKFGPNFICTQGRPAAWVHIARALAFQLPLCAPASWACMKTTERIPPDPPTMHHPEPGHRTPAAIERQRPSRQVSHSGQCPDASRGCEFCRHTDGFQSSRS